MISLWANLSEQDRVIYRVTTEFLKDRFEERATIDWALQLAPHEIAKRSALLELISNRDNKKLSDPWKTAWRLIEESWDTPDTSIHKSGNIYEIKHRIDTGDRSGTLVTAIVELVMPKLKVEKFSTIHLHYHKQPKRPKKVQDLFSIGLTSGNLVNPNEIKISDITDSNFLYSLSLALDAAVTKGIDIAKRISLNETLQNWQLGQLNRVYYVDETEHDSDNHEPDEFHRGIAPAVLFHNLQKSTPLSLLTLFNNGDYLIHQFIYVFGLLFHVTQKLALQMK